MKKIRNILIAFIIVGIVLGVVAIALYRFDFDVVYAEITQADKYQLIEKEFDESQIKDSLELDFDNSSISVSPSADGKYRLAYYKHIDLGTETENYGEGRLYFKYREKWSFRYSLRPINITDPKFYKAVLQIPADFIGDLTLKVSNGKVNVGSLSGINSMDIKSNNGAIILSSIGANTIKTDSDNGNVELNNCAAQAAVIENHNGTIKLDGCTVNGELNINDNNGTIRLDNCTLQTAVIKNNNGLVELNSCNGIKVSVDSSNGSVRINSGEFDAVHVKNQNGNNTVSLNGSRSDYAVELITSNGKSRLNGEKFEGQDGNKDREKQVYLKTNNGDNNLSFI